MWSCGRSRYLSPQFAMFYHDIQKNKLFIIAYCCFEGISRIPSDSSKPRSTKKLNFYHIFHLLCFWSRCLYTKTTIFSTYKFKLSITIAGGFFWRKKSVSWKEWWQNVSIMSRWPVLARGGEGEESLTILEILSEQQSMFLKIYYSAKWIFECHDNRGEAQTAGKGSAWLIVNPLKHATLVCVSRGPCCKYDVLVAHCVGFCEKRHFAQMTCNVNKVMMFSVFSTESRC